VRLKKVIINNLDTIEKRGIKGLLVSEHEEAAVLGNREGI